MKVEIGGITGEKRKISYIIYFTEHSLSTFSRNTQLILQEETAIKQVRETKEAIAMKMQ